MLRAPNFIRVIASSKTREPCSCCCRRRAAVVAFFDVARLLLLLSSSRRCRRVAVVARLLLLLSSFGYGIQYITVKQKVKRAKYSTRAVGIILHARPRANLSKLTMAASANSRVNFPRRLLLIVQRRIPCLEYSIISL